MASETKFKETEIGMIPEDWNLCQFEDLFEVPLRNGLTRPKKMKGSGIKMVNMGELFSYERIFSNIETDKVPISEDEFEKFKLKKGDLLFARQSLVLEGAGKCSIIMDDIIPATFESHIIRGRLNEKLADPLFYFYFYKSTIGRNLVSSIVEQVAAAGIRGSDLSKLSVLYPPIEEQKSIANVFSILDDKIELNNQMNKTLEQIAQTLFKHWFIDFEFPDENGNPYKSSGGRMVDSELGEIPEGWRVGKLGDISGEKRKNIKVKDINPETPYFGLEHIPRKSISLSDWGSASEVSSNKLIFEKDDILFGKIRPYFHKVGVAPIEGVCSTDIIVISPEEDYYSFVLSTVSSEKFVEFATQTSEGTKMPRANWRTLVKYPVVIPDKLTSKKYNEIVLAFVGTIQKNIFECKNLSQIRDSFLPKLMSGKIRIEC